MNAPCIGLERGPERRLAWRTAPLFAVAPVLVHPDRGAVDHLQIAIVGLGNFSEDAVPHADLALRWPPHRASLGVAPGQLRPAPEPIGAGRGRAVALGDVGPGRAGPQPPVDAVQHAAIIEPAAHRGVCWATTAV